MAAKSKVIHVAVERATDHLLKEQAKREDSPVSAIIRRAIHAYLQAKQQTSQAGN
jgi:hypothetical protein